METDPNHSAKKENEIYPHKKGCEQELVDVAQNSDRANATFFLSTTHKRKLTQYLLRRAAQALQTTNSVYFMEILIYQVANYVTKKNEKTIKDICSFLSTNPMIKSIDVILGQKSKNTGNRKVAGNLLLSAAAQNESIEKILICGRQDYEQIEIDLQESQINISKHVKELEFQGGFDYNRANWSENYTLETLILKDVNEDFSAPPERMFDGRLSDLWDTLTQKSITVNHLGLDLWSRSLPLYMLSPKSNIQQLDLASLSFEGSTRYQMDGLIYGLVGSQTVRTLNLIHCEIDSVCIHNLRRAIQSGITGIKHFGFYQREKEWSEFEETDFHAVDLKKFLACDCLETLNLVIDEPCIDDKDQFMDGVKEWLPTSCSLTTFGLSTPQLERLAPSLKIALSSRTLRGLVLGRCKFNKSSLDSLVSLIQDKQCQLLSLELDHWDEESETHTKVVPRILEAIACGGNMQTLVLKSDVTLDGFVSGVQNSFHKIQSLKIFLFLLDKLFGAKHPSQEQECLLSQAFASNWSLEHFLLAQHLPGARDDDVNRLIEFGNPSYLPPITTTAFKRKVEGLCLRNKEKKLIFETESDNISLEKKKQLIENLESYWALPDSLSLSFWLLERLASVLF